MVSLYKTNKNFDEQYPVLKCFMSFYKFSDIVIQLDDEGKLWTTYLVEISFNFLMNKEHFYF